MKLLTYFRASELALIQSINEIMIYGKPTKKGRRRERQSAALRDGMMLRAERLEMQNELLKDRILQLLQSDFGSEND